MTTFLLTIGIMTTITALMSLGLIMKRPLKGSCGGIDCRCKE